MALYEVSGARDDVVCGVGRSVSVDGGGGGDGDRFLEIVAFFSPLWRGTISGRSTGLPDVVISW